MAARAGSLQREDALRLTHAACAAAGRTDLRLGAGFGAAARTGLAGDRDRNVDLRGFAGEGLLERDFHVVAKISAALAAATTSATSGHAEQVFKNIGERGSEARAETGTAAALLESGMAIAVIGGTLVAVLQDLIGFGNFLELVLASRIARILVLMPFHRELAKCALETGFIEGTFYFQLLVITALSHGRSGSYISNLRTGNSFCESLPREGKAFQKGLTPTSYCSCRRPPR